MALWRNQNNESPILGKSGEVGSLVLSVFCPHGALNLFWRSQRPIKHNVFINPSYPHLDPNWSGVGSFSQYVPTSISATHTVLGYKVLEIRDGSFLQQLNQGYRNPFQTEATFLRTHYSEFESNIGRSSRRANHVPTYIIYPYGTLERGKLSKQKCDFKQYILALKKNELTSF